MAKRPEYDWEQIKSEYITGRISLRGLHEKYGVSQRLINERSRKEQWRAQREKYRDRVVRKVVTKTVTKQANELMKEIDAVDKISDILAKTLADTQQFNRHIIQTREKNGKHEEWDAEERVFDKVDTKALKEAAQTLRLVEQMKRSMQSIRTMQEEQAMDIAERRIRLEEQRLELDQKRQNMGADTSEHGIVILAPVLEEDDDE